MNTKRNKFFLINFFFNFIKLNIIIFIIYSIFLYKHLKHFLKKIIYNNFLSKLIILNETEKEIGSVDDFLFFTLLFIVTVSFIIISIISVVIFHNNIYIWINASFALFAFLFLTLPINLFYDYGISFVMYIKGSSSSSNFLKELIFDFISTFIVFIRFIVQNIRFLFILLAIFELLEWITNNNNILVLNYINNNNFFINVNYLQNDYSIIFINSILFIIEYFYYSLHLLFLILIQIIVYIGISVWLFFFLYSTKFLSKYEKYFIIK